MPMAVDMASGITRPMNSEKRVSQSSVVGVGSEGPLMGQFGVPFGSAGQQLRLAQLTRYAAVAPATQNPRVAGSIPALATISLRVYTGHMGDLASMDRRNTCFQNVGWSLPA